MRDTEKPWHEFRAAVRQRRYDIANKLLKKDPGLIISRNGIGETVLHYLAVENDRDGVAWLHDKGADLNTKNKFGNPLLFEVAQLGYKELFSWFVEKGADLRAVDAGGQDLIAYLSQYRLTRMIEFVREYFESE